MTRRSLLGAALAPVVAPVAALAPIVLQETPKVIPVVPYDDGLRFCAGDLITVIGTGNLIPWFVGDPGVPLGEVRSVNGGIVAVRRIGWPQE